MHMILKGKKCSEKYDLEHKVLNKEEVVWQITSTPYGRVKLCKWD